MGRPRINRRICGLPENNSFGPLDKEIFPDDILELGLDEFEAIRLIDLVECTQDEVAAQMGVSRTTLQACYEKARRKLADALVNGKHLVIQGGTYVVCPHSRECCNKGQERFTCSKRHCQKEFSKQHMNGGCPYEDRSNV